MTDVVQAAGGVVVRDGPDGPRVALVHRPRYDDWSLPKGKADAGETPEATALREVAEETGMRCKAVRRVGEARYRDARGRPKVVHYWLMEPESGTDAFTPGDEVDDLRWCSPSESERLLSYDHDREVVRWALAGRT